MIVNQGIVASYCDREYDSDIEKIHQSLESWIKETTGHDWEETSYVEFITADGGSKIFLKHYPVYQITEIAPITAGIMIRNISTDSRNAYISIDSDSLDLAVIGGTNAMTASLAFATYLTLTTLIAQINTEAKGWSATIYNSKYASYPSSALMEIKNFFCGARRGATPGYRNLEMLDTPYADYVCDEDTGEVYRSSGWITGYRKIVAKYSAYHTIPSDITGAVLNGVKFLVTQREEGTEGIASYTTADLSARFESIMPSYVLDVVKLHSRVM